MLFFNTFATAYYTSFPFLAWNRITASPFYSAFQNVLRQCLKSFNSVFESTDLFERPDLFTPVNRAVFHSCEGLGLWVWGLVMSYDSETCIWWTILLVCGKCQKCMLSLCDSMRCSVANMLTKFLQVQSI